MSTNVTPDKARALLRGDFASDARQTSVGNLEANFDSFTGAHIAGTPGDFALTEEAGALAELAANMHYEYAVQVLDEQWRTLGDAWTSKQAARDRFNATPGKNTGRVRIVRRLATDPEVVE